LFDVKLYTGNGSTQTISGLEFSPDLVWIKNRAAADSHKLTDTVRGATEELESDTTAAEATNADGLTQFNADGFDLGDDDEYNTSAEAYAAWAWDAGSSTVTNTDGSISSQVRANASAGFSVITLTTPSSSGSFSVGHGLGVKPAFVIWKSRTTAGNYWFCQHAGLGNMVDYYIRLESTNGRATSVGRWVNEPTSTLLYSEVGNTWNASDSLVCYAWAPLAGYSSFGSYVGNGSASDGPFVYTGFRPRWVMIKASSSTGEWGISDSARDTYNVVSNVLLAENSGADNTGLTLLDFTSNGFKLRNSNSNRNGSGVTYIYFAVAESPFQYARAR
jgi:hypothetical protein